MPKKKSRNLRLWVFLIILLFVVAIIFCGLKLWKNYEDKIGYSPQDATAIACGSQQTVNSHGVGFGEGIYYTCLSNYKENQRPFAIFYERVCYTKARGIATAQANANAILDCERNNVPPSVSCGSMWCGEPPMGPTGYWYQCKASAAFGTNCQVTSSEITDTGHLIYYGPPRPQDPSQCSGNDDAILICGARAIATADGDKVVSCDSCSGVK